MGKLSLTYSRVPIRRGVRNKCSGTQDEKCIGRNISHMCLGLYSRCRFILTNLYLKVLHFDILIQLKGTAHFLETVLGKRTVSSNWNKRVACRCSQGTKHYLGDASKSSWPKNSKVVHLSVCTEMCLGVLDRSTKQAVVRVTFSP